MAMTRIDIPVPPSGPDHPVPSIGGRRIKYALDRVVAAVALLFTAPILALLAFSLWASRTRPVLRAERRLAEGGRTIVLYSFAIGAEHLRKRRWRVVMASGAAVLPQLWSVLRGDLSLVGPRPRELGLEPPPTRPGLTGPAQIQQLDGWVTLADQLQLDDDYARAWSLRLDLGIVWRTIVRTLR
jgi:lipopolysaccharide/colanic/teichoic acid biosynthesis glycosyltransferase